MVPAILPHIRPVLATRDGADTGKVSVKEMIRDAVRAPGPRRRSGPGRPARLHRQLITVHIHPYGVPVAHLARQDGAGELVADGGLDQTAQRPGAVGHVRGRSVDDRFLAEPGEPGQGTVGDVQPE